MSSSNYLRSFMSMSLMDEYKLAICNSWLSFLAYSSYNLLLEIGLMKLWCLSSNAYFTRDASYVSCGFTRDASTLATFSSAVSLLAREWSKCFDNLVRKFSSIIIFISAWWAERKSRICWSFFKKLLRLSWLLCFFRSSDCSRSTLSRSASVVCLTELIKSE